MNKNSSKLELLRTGMYRVVSNKEYNKFKLSIMNSIIK